jgi:hypothetical protein
VGSPPSSIRERLPPPIRREGVRAAVGAGWWRTVRPRYLRFAFLRGCAAADFAARFTDFRAAVARDEPDERRFFAAVVELTVRRVRAGICGVAPGDAAANNPGWYHSHGAFRSFTTTSGPSASTATRSSSIGTLNLRDQSRALKARPVVLGCTPPKFIAVNKSLGDVFGQGARRSASACSRGSPMTNVGHPENRCARMSESKNSQKASSAPRKSQWAMWIFHSGRGAPNLTVSYTP